LHSDPQTAAEDSLEDLRSLDTHEGYTVVGKSFGGGLLATKFKETDCPDPPSFLASIGQPRREKRH
jgi:hypothetical protein